MRTIPWDSDRHCWEDALPAELVSLYKPYARRLRIGVRPALIVVDAYRLAFSGNGEIPSAAATASAGCGYFAERAREPLRRTIEIARVAGVPIWFTSMERATGRATFRPNTTDDSEYEFEPGFEPGVDDRTIIKTRASAFNGTPLLSDLVRSGIDSLIVCGNTTSGCVRATAVDAQAFGFHAVVSEEATFDRAIEPHVQNMFDLHHKYADCMSVASLAFLLGPADTRAQEQDGL